MDFLIPSYLYLKYVKSFLNDFSIGSFKIRYGIVISSTISKKFAMLHYSSSRFSRCPLKANPCFLSKSTILARTFTAQKIKFSIRELRIWSHLLKKSLMENFIFCAVLYILGIYFITVLNVLVILIIDSITNFFESLSNSKTLSHGSIMIFFTNLFLLLFCNIVPVRITSVYKRQQLRSIFHDLLNYKSRFPLKLLQ